jgi:hypothetical protein
MKSFKLFAIFPTLCEKDRENVVKPNIYPSLTRCSWDNIKLQFNHNSEILVTLDSEINQYDIDYLQNWISQIQELAKQQFSIEITIEDWNWVHDEKRLNLCSDEIKKIFLLRSEIVIDQVLIHTIVNGVEY